MGTRYANTHQAHCVSFSQKIQVYSDRHFKSLSQSKDISYSAGKLLRSADCLIGLDVLHPDAC